MSAGLFAPSAGRATDVVGAYLFPKRYVIAVAPGFWEKIAGAASPPDLSTLAWDPTREAIAGVVGGLPVTVTTEQVLAFSAGEGITPTEAATLIVAAELQRFVA